MEKTIQMQLIEARAGKDIRLVLQEAYDEAGNLEGAAALISERYPPGLTFPTLSEWIGQLDGRIRKTIEWNVSETAGVAG